MISALSLASSDRAQEHELFRVLWPKLPVDEPLGEVSQKFVDHMENELKILETQGGCFPPMTRAAMIRVIATLREKMADTLADIINHLASKEQLEPKKMAKYRASVELAARIWLTVNVDSFALAPASQAFPPAETPTWDVNASLQSLVKTKFPDPSPAGHTLAMIPSRLTMVELCSGYKCRVRWTSNLLDHLKIRYHGRFTEITFYEHLLFLDYHLQYADETPFPKAMLEEAIDTFNLFFPVPPETRIEKSTRRFLDNNDRNFHLLGLCGRERRFLELDKYRYWRPNIQKLVEIVSGPAPTWKKVFLLDRDTRNLEKVLTVWIAIVATALAFITFIFGILAIVLAFQANSLETASVELAREANGIAREALAAAQEANRIAVDSFELDRLQACLAPNATEGMSQFCAYGRDV